MKNAIETKKIKKSDIRTMIHESVGANVLTKAEAQECLAAEDLRDDVVLVDEFTQEEYMKGSIV